MIAEHFRAFLKADTTARAGGRTCWQRISYCPSGTGGDNKSCFLFDPPPENAQASAAAPGEFIVTITEEPGGSPWGTRAKRGVEAIVTVRVYSAKGFTDAGLGDMAFDLWRVFDRANIQVTDYDQWGCQADSPQDDKDNLRYPAYRFGVRIRLLET